MGRWRHETGTYIVEYVVQAACVLLVSATEYYGKDVWLVPRKTLR